MDAILTVDKKINTPIKIINPSAFDSCNSLQSIKIPESLETIEKNAFEPDIEKKISITTSIKCKNIRTV